VAAFLLLVLMGVLVDAYYQSNRIYGQLEVAMPSLRQASESLARGRLPAGDPFGKADRAVRRAVATVNHARFTFKLAGAIPLFGRPVQAIRHGVTAAGEVTGAALVTQRAVSDLLGEAARTPGSVRASDTPLYRGGAVDVQLLESLGRRLDAVVAHLRAAGREIAEIRSIPLLPKVNEVRRQTSRDTSRAIQVAERMRAGARVLPPFLGAHGKRTYLIALQNQASLRGTGGALLAYGLVTVDRGRFELITGGSVNELRVDPSTLRPGLPRRRIDVRLPDSVAWYIDNVPRAYPWMGTANFSPDFPPVALTWARMAQRATSRRIDGVIAMDQVAVARALGSRRIRVPGYRGWITGDNVVEVVSHDQYLLPMQQQIEFPALLVAAAWPKIVEPGSLQASLRSFGESLRQRRIQLWLARDDLQQDIRRLGWDGSLQTPPGDFLSMVDNSVSGYKVDLYGRVSLHYRVNIEPSGNADATLDVTLTNDSPNGLPWLIAGRPGKVGGYAVNKALLLAFVPERARLLESTPDTGLPDHVEAGARVFSRTLKVAAGEAETMRLRYRIDDVLVPAASGRLYRLTVRSQPLLTPAHLTVTVTLPKGSDVQSAPRGWTVRGNVLTFETDLVHDLISEIAF
jgi:Protein of unknown function (DUF4012)